MVVVIPAPVVLAMHGIVLFVAMMRQILPAEVDKHMTIVLVAAFQPLVAILANTDRRPLTPTVRVLTMVTAQTPQEHGIA